MEAEVKQDRKTFIGGSDIAAVLGLSRWKSPLGLWAQKTGKLEDDPLSNFEAKEIGLELEEYVARKFSRKTGLAIRRQPQEYRHPVYPYMVCHLDRLVLDGKAVLEAKTTSAWNLKEWDGDSIPQEYVLQVMWQLGLTRRQVGWIAVLIGGQKFLHKQIAFDQELFEKMVESARVFWEEFVEKDIPPVATADDQETLARLFPLSREQTMTFDGEEASEINRWLEDRAACINTVKMAEKEISNQEALLKQKLGDAAFGETEKFRFSWKSQSRTVPDTQAMKEAGILEQYSKTASFRVLRATRKEEVSDV